MAKKQITKEQIVQEACALVCEKGIDALNARAIAKQCNCSTQPIYLCFDSMQKLKEAVQEEILHSYDHFLSEEIASGKYPEYKATGMGYIRFAKEKPNYFKYLFMRDRNGERTDGSAYYFEREASRVQKYGFNGADAERIHTHMWVYVHGIATMFATGFLNWDWDTVGKLLTEEFFAVKNYILGEKRQ